MLDPTGTGKSTPRRVLPEELEGRLQRLSGTLRWIKQSAGSDNCERVRADAVAVAIEHVQSKPADLQRQPPER